MWAETVISESKTIQKAVQLTDCLNTTVWECVKVSMLAHQVSPLTIIRLGFLGFFSFFWKGSI